MNEHLSLLVERYVPTMVILVHNNDKHGLMINAGVFLTSSRRLIFGGPVIALVVFLKGLGICDALLCVSHTLPSALESVQGA